MTEGPQSEQIDWSRTTWEGSRREQIERWARLSLDEILEAQEEMAELALELSPKRDHPCERGSRRRPAGESPHPDDTGDGP